MSTFDPIFQVTNHVLSFVFHTASISLLLKSVGVFEVFFFRETEFKYLQRESVLRTHVVQGSPLNRIRSRMDARGLLKSYLLVINNKHPLLKFPGTPLYNKIGRL